MKYQGLLFRARLLSWLLFVFVLICGDASAFFVHPGISHNQDELEFVKSKIDAGKQPWKQAWDKLCSSSFADLSWKPKPVAHVERGAYNRPDIGGTFFMRDATAAYTHALQWVFTGREAHAVKAAEILNGWSSSLKSISNHDAKLLVGMAGVQFCNAAELLKYTWNGWSEGKQEQFKTMLRKVLYPVIEDFFPEANGNWDASMIQTMMAMGIFLDDEAMFQRAVNYFLNGVGNGAVNHYFYCSGQCQESGRDQGHTQMGLEYLLNSCEIAWKQGVDLYSAYNNRLAKGFEYTAKYNLGMDVPFEYSESYKGWYKHKKISGKSRGRLRPMYEKVYNHYHNRMGMEMLYSRQVLERTRPECGGVSSLPWSTLMFADQPPGLVSIEKRIISRYQAVFNAPPRKTPSRTAVDGPLLGNGDLGVTISGPPEAQRFWISKNDFWRLKSQYGASGSRVFGGIDIKIPTIKGANYLVKQDLYRAITTERFSTNDKTVSMRCWVSATCNLLIIELSITGGSADVELNLWAAQGNGSSVQGGEEDNIRWVTREFSEGVDIPVKAACAMIQLTEGKALSRAHTLELRSGKAITIAAAIQSSFDSKTFLDDARKMAGDFDGESLQKLRGEHAAWWQNFWSRSFVEIGDPLIEQRYYLSNYVMASCSRNPCFPPPIFGTWITTDNPSWFGDYHLNYNHMAPYYGLYSSNHIEQADPFEAPVLDFIDRGRWYARNILNMRGVYYPVGIGPKGIETTRNSRRHAGWHEEKGGLFFGQKSNAAYCAVNIAMRWYHTYERKYALKTYPFVRDVAGFWEDYLKFENNRYVIYRDAIHEGSGDNNDFNPILSLGLVRMVFELALDMSTFLEKDANRHPKWKHILAHMSDFPTQQKDGVKVFRYTEKGTAWWNGNTLGIQHIFPAGAVGLESSDELLDVSRNTIRLMNRWIDHNGMNSFFPAAVRVGYDPETILEKLRGMIRKVGQANGFTRGNPHGIENCSIVPNTIDEMLCMGHKNVLRLFPVWPRNKDARFGNLRIDGAFLVSSELKLGRVQYVRIHSEKGRPCMIQNPWPGRKVSVFRNSKKHESVEGVRFILQTKKNEDIYLCGNQMPFTRS